MAHFVIDQIGPIRHAEFDLNRVNIFIGPQSVGKSTIAKIVSFCLWLEKYTIRQQRINNVSSKFIKNSLISYHKMNSYFGEGSYFKYIGNTIDFEYFHNKKYHFKKKEGFSEAEVGKVAYIPAERSIVSMANVSSYKLEDDYVRDFVFEWLRFRSKFSRDEAVQIPGTSVQYFYDAEKGGVIELSDNKTINLTESSSGLQSLIPLYLYCLYVSKWIYNNSIDMSYADMEKILDGVSRNVFNDLRKNDIFSAIIKGDKYEDNIDIMSHLIRKMLTDDGDSSSENVRKALSKIAEKTMLPHYTQLIIEEPELNLFPETQVELLYSILRLIHNDRKDSLIITTHSPYILYALNNCILANIVRERMPKAKFERVKCSDVVLDPKEVSVFELDNGEFRPIEQNIDAGKYTIQDNFGLIRQNFFDRVMKGIMEDFNSLLRYRV
ncbi:MAG: AAA family ATPase [Bacteroidales bacterium]|nr:AAA family ATPase [Bacteroidales bacterium]